MLHACQVISNLHVLAEVKERITPRISFHLIFICDWGAQAS